MSRVTVGEEGMVRLPSEHGDTDQSDDHLAVLCADN